MGEDNRVELLLRNWRAEHPTTRSWNRMATQLELDFFDKLYLAFKRSPNPDERESLSRLEGSIRNSIYQLKPDLLERISAFMGRVMERGALVLFNLLDRKSQEELDRGLAPKWIPKGMSAAAREEKDGQISSLLTDLKANGLPGRISEHAKTLLYYGSDSFELTDRIGSGLNGALVSTRVEKSSFTGRYYPIGYDLVSYRGLTPSREEAAGINVRSLDQRMATIDWTRDYTGIGVGSSSRTADNMATVEAVNSIFRDLGALLVSGDPEARRIHDQLAVKYFADTPNSGIIE